ncbi:hypothetical protein GQ44DRAFT_709872 [Phaeosphaeriaceae sp. PMI808]|nr:hypothetical protein GQ44DRAFT_709872 [Phaeosphaeriaceae sp. PMI808]
MLFKKKREGDVEMEAMRVQKESSAPEETEYRPINWKKIFLSPKYLGKAFGILIIVATVMITIKHDKAVAVIQTPLFFLPAQN